MQTYAKCRLEILMTDKKARQLMCQYVTSSLEHFTAHWVWLLLCEQFATLKLLKLLRNDTSCYVRSKTENINSTNLFKKDSSVFIQFLKDTQQSDYHSVQH